MMPVELTNLYGALRQRVAIHVPSACAEVSLPMPAAFDGELAFFRLVNWSYVLINEAARVSFSYLTSLPPLRGSGDLKKNVGYLRTYVAHNLDVTNKHDAKTAAATHRWFREACGHGTPRDPAHFVAACGKLCDQLRHALEGAIDACDALDDPVDGSRLIGDLRDRVDLSWAAYRFDPIVQECATVLGNPGLDLVRLRGAKLDGWRRVLAEAEEGQRETAVRLRIEADLLTAIADALPITAQEALRKLAFAGPEAVTAGLIILRDARRVGGLAVPELIELAASGINSST